VEAVRPKQYKVSTANCEVRHASLAIPRSIYSLGSGGVTVWGFIALQWTIAQVSWVAPFNSYSLTSNRYFFRLPVMFETSVSRVHVANTNRRHFIRAGSEHCVTGTRHSTSCFGSRIRSYEFISVAQEAWSPRHSWWHHVLGTEVLNLAACLPDIAVFGLPFIRRCASQLPAWRLVRQTTAPYRNHSRLVAFLCKIA
jgi:hypothetical protein